MLTAEIRHRIAPVQAQDRIPGKCWIWRGSINRDGYGRVHANRADHYTHRLVYESLVDRISEGLQLDHLCRVRACCKPSHLEPVTQQVNLRRGERATRARCIHGHVLVGPNLILRHPSKSGGRRDCRTCLNARVRKSYRLKRREREAGA